MGINPSPDLCHGVAMNPLQLDIGSLNHLGVCRPEAWSSSDRLIMGSSSNLLGIVWVNSSFATVCGGFVNEPI